MNSNASATSQTIQERHGSDLKLQDIFLNQCRREHVPVAIHFIDQSVKYGQIIGFDQLCIVLRTNGHQRLAFKSAICMIDPQEDFSYIFNDPQRLENQKKSSKSSDSAVVTV
jgi:host factor-I protein